MSLLLLIVLILLIVGGIPAGPWWGANGSSFGWGPSGILGVILIVVVILALTGRI